MPACAVPIRHSVQASATMRGFAMVFMVPLLRMRDCVRPIVAAMTHRFPSDNSGAAIDARAIKRVRIRTVAIRCAAA
ncbi:hypothetical protein GCM10025759_19960 [Lysobacter panacisoli]|uniref:Uncharacterized protein n=1 Tax=Lysobacter panacisoli TaxID=1255263 RepID=A0ABP9LGQ0_9GAMM